MPQSKTTTKIPDSRLTTFAEICGESGLTLARARRLADVAWGVLWRRASPAQIALFKTHFEYGVKRRNVGRAVLKGYPDLRGLNHRELGQALRKLAPGALWESVDIAPTRLFVLIQRMLGKQLDQSERDAIGIGYYGEDPAARG